MTPTQTQIAATLAVLLIAGCGDRAAFWSQPVDLPPSIFGLRAAVAVVDRPTERVVTLVPGDGQSVAVRSLATGHTILNTAVSADGQRLFVLAAGHRAGLGDPQPDEAPSLTIVDTTPAADAPARRIDLPFLTDPLSGLALDPGGRWAVLYPRGQGAASTAFVENPNELVILDVSAGATAQPVAHTLKSFGGQVVRLAFTPALLLPGGRQRHLLIVESDQDLSILQLEEPALPEISVPLTSGGDTRRLAPAAVTVDDGDPARDDDARIGVRLDGDSSLVTLQLAAAQGGNGFLPTVNLSDAGGVPTDIAFVRTDGGLRLAALVPARRQAVLVDPETGAVDSVALPAAYQSLSLVTDAAGATAGTDVALLWNGDGATAGAAFWDLGRTTGTPYRSVEPIALSEPVSGVLDVPAPRQGLKVLATRSGDAFFLLDLSTRTAAPLLTNAPSIVALGVSPFGDQLLSFAPASTDAAVIDLGSVHPRSLLVDRPIHQLFEVARPDGGGRSLIAIHDEGTIGATVFDAATADSATRRLYAGLLLEETP
jgi:hypothetical protein